jgi:hypothetical protein
MKILDSHLHLRAMQVLVATSAPAECHVENYVVPLATHVLWVSSYQTTLCIKEKIKMKFKLNRAFREASGELDGLVYRNVRGNVVVSRKPDTSNVVSSESQIAHRERFKQAAAYGKSVMADAETRALYEAAAKSKNIPVFALTIADFFNAPTIDSLDLSDYTGQVHEPINIMACDDFGVANVSVSIADQTGNVIEAGNAVETAAGSGHWVYTAAATVATGVTVTVTAIATDRPGGTAVKTANKTI